MKRVLKLTLANILLYSGMLRLFRRVMNNRFPGRVLILVYHSVVSEEDPGWIRSRAGGLAVDVRLFERQMEFLSRHYTVLPLEALVESLRSRKPLPTNACAVTFDDGFEDNFRNAWPVMRRFGLPGTFFLPTGFVNTDRIPWYIELADFVELLPGSGFCASDIPAEICPKPIADLLNLLRNGKEPGAVSLLLEEMKKLPADRINRILAVLRSNLNSQFQGRHFTMNWEEARQMRESGMSFGTHTQNHRILTVEEESTAKEEILSSMRDFRSNLGIQPTGFAYPNGAWNATVKQMVEHAGYEFACSMEERAADYDSDLFALPRREINGIKSTNLSGHFSPALFEATIQGIFIPKSWNRPKPEGILSGCHSQISIRGSAPEPPPGDASPGPPFI